MALCLDVADAVAAELAKGSFAVEIEPRRLVLPSFSLADLADLRVTVVPKAVEITGASRSLAQHDVQVDIGIQKKVGPEMDSEVTALCGLVEEVATFLKRRPLAAAPHVAWVQTANDPIYVPAHLAEQRVFTSVLTATYRTLA